MINYGHSLQYERSPYKARRAERLRNAGSYRAIYQSGTGDWSSISSVGNVNRGTLQVSESGTVGVQLFDEQNGAHWLWQDKKLLPFADAKMSLKRTTQIFPAETKGLFYAKDDQSETELFVMFSGEMVIFAGLGPKKTAPSQTINGKPKLEEYHFFVGAGIKDSSAPPLANAWHATGPGGGGAWTVVKVSPANPDIAFLGSDVGGLYKTEDGGETWTNANTGLALPEMKSQVYYVNDVGFHPLDPSVMYLSTGGGVFKSGDGGNSWPLRFVHKPVSLLATHAEMPDLVLLGEGQVHTEATTFSSGKIYRSTDALSTAPTTITLPFSADTPTVYGLSLYRKDAASASLSALACTDFGFYESNDAGQSWTYMDSVAAGLPHEDCRAMVVAESQGIISVLLETKFDLVSNDMASWKGGVFRSGDWGATWEAANGNIENNLLTNAAFETAAVNHPGPPLGWIFKGKTPDDNVLRICDSNALLGQGCSLLVDTTNILDSELGSYGVRTADSIAVDGGSRYRISFYAKVAPLASYAGAKSIFARIYWKDANQQYLTPVCMESGMHLNVLTSTDENTPWKRYEVDVIAPADAMSADLDLFSYQVKGQVWFDDVSVRKSHALPKAVNYKKPSGGVGLETAPFVIHYRFLNQDTANPARLRVGIPTAYREPLISGIWGSDDGGLTWEHLTRTCYDTNIDLSRRGQSKEVYSLGIGSDANKSRSYFGTGKWLWRTTDGSQNWQEVTANQNIDGSWSAAGDTNDTFVYGFAFDPNDKDRIYFGDADNCSFVTYDGGQSYFQIGCWDDIGISGDTATSIVVDPADANVLYLGISAHDTIVAGTPGGVAKTVYDGQQWQSQNLDPGGLIRGGGVFLALDPNSSPTNRTLYAGVYSVGIFKTSDGGLSWSSLNQNTWTPKPQKDGIDSWEIYRLAVDGQSGRIFAGFGNPKAGSPADAPESATGIWMSQDGGTNWTKITATSTEMGGEPILALLPIAADKIYTGTWYAKKASGGGLYEGVETNGQWSWQRLLQQPRTVGVGLSHTNGQLIYAASGQWPGPPAGQVAGVYRSENGGQSWSMLDMSGALNLRINQLHVSPKDDTLLFFGTVGGGLFKGVAR